MGRKSDDELFRSMMSDVDASLATDALLSLSGRARRGEQITVSAIQQLSNVRAVAGGRYQLAPDAVRECEDKIRGAKIIGEIDPALKNIDPAYVRALCPRVADNTSQRAKQSGCAIAVLILLGASFLALQSR